MVTGQEKTERGNGIETIKITGTGHPVPVFSHIIEGINEVRVHIKGPEGYKREPLILCAKERLTDAGAEVIAGDGIDAL